MEQARGIVAGLGGADNIEEIEPCITRLRVEVADPDKVDEQALTEAGAFGVVQVGDSIQVVVGPIADNLAEEIDDLL